jgi:hypothetical protein
MDYLGVEENVFKPVVFFIGDCEFKTLMPRNVLNDGLTHYIKGFHAKCLTPAQVADFEARLMALKENKALTRQAHLDSLHDRHESVTVCPRCGKRLVLRVARKGKSTGDAFLGCSGYPKCRFTKPVSG